MSLANIRQKAKSAQPKTETSSGSRIQMVAVEGEEDENYDLVESHFFGKQLKKEGEGLLGRARRLYANLTRQLLKDRTPNRPKQFKFSAKIREERNATQDDVELGRAAKIGDIIVDIHDHTTTVNVRENGYRAFDDNVLEQVTAIVGQQFVDSYITTHIEGKVDFSLVSQDKHDDVAALLGNINEFCGADVIEWEITNKPNSSFHVARASLTTEQDAKLNDVVPMTLAFGR